MANVNAKVVKTDKKPKVRYAAGDNTNVNPINGPIAKSANPNVPGPGNDPGSTYTRASGTVLTRAQELANAKTVQKEKAEAKTAARDAKNAAMYAKYQKQHQDKIDKENQKQIKPGTH